MYSLIMFCHINDRFPTILVKWFYFCPKKLIHNEPEHNKTNKNTCAPSEDSRLAVWSEFAVHFMGSYGSKPSSGRQWRLWPDWEDAQADLSLCGHWSFCWFCRAPAHMLSASVGKTWIISLNNRNLAISFVTPQPIGQFRETGLGCNTLDSMMTSHIIRDSSTNWSIPWNRPRM